MSIHSANFGSSRAMSVLGDDAEFASHWLAAAVDADRILTRHRSANPDFETATKT